eukprot:TRINITY_DN10252_c0_g1_i1.p1 TRINITY_DN10252_c0_g1~~TRINITY_DN10252_c0_g1_i1.p1  ORF type:complete len:245 (+),score=4.62 TRINITY_DN10252_c0_g1_i1:77-811(+)
MRHTLYYLSIISFFFGLLFSQNPTPSCPTGFYGDDCTCTLDFLRLVPGSIATCSNGVWATTEVIDFRTRSSTVLPLGFQVLQLGGLFVGSNTIEFGINITSCSPTDAKYGKIILASTTSANFADATARVNYNSIVGISSDCIIDLPVVQGPAQSSFPNTFADRLLGTQPNCFTLRPTLASPSSELIIRTEISPLVDCVPGFPDTPNGFEERDRTWVLALIIVFGSLGILAALALIIYYFVKVKP